MTVVVDANILIGFGLADEPLHTQANQILSAWQSIREHLTAPRLFRSEVTAVVRKVVYQRCIATTHHADTAFDLSSGIPRG